MRAKRLICSLQPQRRGRSLICVYHSVAPDSSVSIPPDEFRLQMTALRESYRTVSIPELMSRLDQGETGLAAVTFDDGYRDCYEHAFPILQDLSIPLTLFVTSGFVETGTWTFSAEYSALPPLTWPQIREMQRYGAMIGGHTHGHCRWSSQSTENLRSDLQLSKRIIEDETGSAVTIFAYPYGQPRDYDNRAAGLLPEVGFRLACTTLHTTFRSSPDPMQIPRLSINAGDTMPDFRQHMSGKRDILALAQIVKSRSCQARAGIFRKSLPPH